MVDPLKPAPDAIIESAWAAWIHDRAVRAYASASSFPTPVPDGAIAYATDTGLYYRGDSAAARWRPLAGQTVAYVLDSTAVSWAALQQVAAETATAIAFAGGSSYAITVAASWRGAVLGDSHYWQLELGTGPGGDFSTVTTPRFWQIANARGTASGNTEQFHGFHVYTPPSNVSHRVRVRVQQASGTGGGSANPVQIEVATR